MIIASRSREIKNDPSPPPPARRWRLKLAVAAVTLLSAAAAGVATGYFLRLDLPSVRQLEDYQPPLITRLYDDRDQLLHQFAEERRILIPVSGLSPDLRNAILAAEDPRFYRHVGIDPRAVVRAAFKDLITLSKTEGASTITQQLARTLFLGREKAWRRKIQEALLALEIERVYTKEEILEFYINQIYLGHGRYGFEAASRYYFGRPAAELDLAQAALLAGLPQRPEGLSPFRNPEAAVRRRNHVLGRMVAEGFLDPATAEAARQEDVVLAEQHAQESAAPYFVEEVRRQLEERYGQAALYQEGLEVRTTLDSEMQDAANRAVAQGLHDLDKRIGWRGPTTNVIDDGQDPETVELPDWEEVPAAGARLPAIVIATTAGEATVRVGAQQATLQRAEVEWTGETDPARLLRRGDQVQVQVLEVTPERLVATLDQEPEIEGALLAIEPASGEVKAMVGGYDFGRSQFNRAIQAQRQAGSAFKPFVYAAALYEGLTPADVLFDEPTLMLEPRTEEVYQPNNYELEYYGIVTLRDALERSVNIASVRLLNAIGYDPVIQIASRLGISSPLRPYPSLALGAAEVNLLEITSAYGTFTNQGVRVEPHLLRMVSERDGKVREVARPAATEALRPDIAYLMVSMLEGVVERGTGKLARVLGRPMGGKTGTTDDYTDAWFVGFTPELAVGVWVGYDKKRSLGKRESGARAALPIWVQFMQEVLAGHPAAPFPAPSNVVRVPIDRRTGLRAGLDTGCHDVILEVFLEGTEPSRTCSPEEHFRMTLPYYLQRYPLDGHRRLVLTPRDLEWLTQWQDARLEGAFGPRRLTTVYEGERTSVPVSLHAGGGIASGRPLVPYLDRLVDGRDVFYQDDIAVPPPEEEEEDEELAQEAAATVNLVPVDPLLDESGFYRRLGVDGRDAVVIYIRR
ncbi:MAG: PBP1A family penicillin-binding protein [Acidobacteriota bacterium]